MNYELIKAAVAAVIKENGNEEITGNLLQQVLHSIINILGVGYQYMGMATPFTVPGTPDARQFYFAAEEGAYSNFTTSPITELDGRELAIFYYDTAWHVVMTGVATRDAMVGYAFYGESLASGSVITGIDENTFFLVGPGTYTINGYSTTISTPGISALMYDVSGDELIAYTLLPYDTTPTEDSKNAITSGAVKTALDSKIDKVSDALTGEIPVFNGDGGLEGSNKFLSDYATQDDLDEVNARIDIVAGEAGLAEAVIDTDNAGTEQEFTFRKSGGDGGAYYRKIKGKTLAWNRLVGADTTEVTIPSGHKYFAVINGTASVATSDGTALAVTGGQDMVVDLTLMGIASEISTPADFEALYSGIYPYNPGTLISNDAEAVETTGANQWDEEWENVRYNTTTGEKIHDASFVGNRNKIPVFPSTNYHLTGGINQDVQGLRFAGRLFEYDANGDFIQQTDSPYRAFTTSNNTHFICFYNTSSYGATYNHDICINLSNAAINGQYFPYWKRTLQLGITTKEDTDGNVPFADGMKGAGTAADWADKVGGEKVMKRVDLGSFEWAYSSTTHRMYITGGVPDAKDVASTVIPNLICTKYTADTYNNTQNNVNDKALNVSNGSIYIYDSASGTDPAAFKAAMQGVMLDYELATPAPFTWAEPLNLGVKVDENGTEKAVAPEGATAPSAPFVADTTYTMSVARMVAKLNTI